MWRNRKQKARPHRPYTGATSSTSGRVLTHAIRSAVRRHRPSVLRPPCLSRRPAVAYGHRPDVAHAARGRARHSLGQASSCLRVLPSRTTLRLPPASPTVVAARREGGSPPPRPLHLFNQHPAVWRPSSRRNGQRGTVLTPLKSVAGAGRADLDFSAGTPAAGEAREKARPHRTHPGASPAVTRRRPAAIPSGGDGRAGYAHLDGSMPRPRRRSGNAFGSFRLENQSVDTPLALGGRSCSVPTARSVSHPCRSLLHPVTSEGCRR